MGCQVVPLGLAVEPNSGGTHWASAGGLQELGAAVQLGHQVNGVGSSCSGQCHAPAACPLRSATAWPTASASKRIPSPCPLTRPEPLLLCTRPPSRLPGARRAARRRNVWGAPRERPVGRRTRVQRIAGAWQVRRGQPDRGSDPVRHMARMRCRGVLLCRCVPQSRAGAFKKVWLAKPHHPMHALHSQACCGMPLLLNAVWGVPTNRL